MGRRDASPPAARGSWAAGLAIEASYCMGCRACEVACKQEHDLPRDVRLIRVVENLDKQAPGLGPAQFRPLVCRHCRNARCVPACSKGALAKDHTGLVTVVPDRCDGCRACLDACPFDVPQFLPGDGTVALCDLCAERRLSGARPACVHHCPADVLSVGAPNCAKEES